MTENAKKSKEQLSELQYTHEDALVQLENYKLLVESVEDYAIFMLDPNGIVMSWNKGAEKFKGYKPNEIIGKHFSTFYLQKDKDNKKPEKELEIAKKHGRVEDEDWRIRKDGSKFWANVIITALFDRDKKLIGFAKVTRDLTDRKRQEDELSNTNMLLKQQQEELKQLNQSKDEFISLASHQLRTPATAVKQLLGLLLEGFQGELTDLQMHTLQRSYESNERQIAIINSLLQVAQLDAGKVILQKKIVSLDAMVEGIIEEQSNSFSLRNQTVTFDRGAEGTDAGIDAKYFRMALENLIDNASKYTPEGGAVHVATKQTDDELIVTVQDTGVGIPEAEMPRLFEKFNRITNDLTHKVSGSGLGLYWAREIIQLHGGTLEVKSKPGEGTLFTVRIPTEDTDA
jgi:PAS domain S-box-containing protein